MRPRFVLSLMIASLLVIFAGKVAANTSETIWKSLEKLPAAERVKKLIAGA